MLRGKYTNPWGHTFPVPCSHGCRHVDWIVDPADPQLATFGVLASGLGEDLVGGVEMDLGISHKWRDKNGPYKWPKINGFPWGWKSPNLGGHWGHPTPTFLTRLRVTGLQESAIPKKDRSLSQNCQEVVSFLFKEFVTCYIFTTLYLGMFCFFQFAE